MTEYEPKKGWYSTWTQRLANGLPSWNDIRRLRTSNGQMLLNAAAGRPLDFIEEQMEEALRNKFLSTTNLNQPDIVTKVEVPQGVQLTQPESIRNRLLNSSFEIWPNQSILPSSWRSDGTGTIAVSSDGFIGTRALTLSTALNQALGIYQEFEENIPTGQEWTFSVWYSITSSLGLTAPATGFGLEAIGYCTDGTTQTLRVAFATNTSGLPKQATVTGTYTKNVYKVRVRLACTHTGAFLFTDSVTIDLVQAEIGDVVTPWRPHPFDYWPHITIQYQLAPVLLESGNRLQYTETMGDFWLKALPTRLTPKVGLTESATMDAVPTPDGDGVTTYGTGGRWVEVDQYNDEWPYQAAAYSSGSSHKIRFIGTITPDIFGTFDLAFRNYRNYYEVDTVITLEAMTEFNNMLWIILKKTNWSGATKRYLAVADPHTPWPRTTYLECPILLEIPEPSTSVRITRCEFRYEDQQHLYIGNGQHTYVYRLHYDYFTIDGNYIYLREDPASVVLIPAETTKKEYTTELATSDFDRSSRRS